MRTLTFSRCFDVSRPTRLSAWPQTAYTSRKPHFAATNSRVSRPTFHRLWSSTRVSIAMWANCPEFQKTIASAKWRVVRPLSHQPSGETKARLSLALRTMPHTSPNPSTGALATTSPTAPHRPTLIRSPGMLWAISTAAEAPVRPREPTSCSAGGSLSSSPRPTAWPRRWGPGASTHRRTTASSGGRARLSGRRTAWVRSTSPGWSSGTRSARSPGPCSRPSSTGLTREAFRSFAAVTRGSHRPLRGNYRTTSSRSAATTTKRSLSTTEAGATSWRLSSGLSGCSPTGSSARRCARLYPSAGAGLTLVTIGTPATWSSSLARPHATKPKSFCSSILPGRTSPPSLPASGHSSPKRPCDDPGPRRGQGGAGLEWHRAGERRDRPGGPRWQMGARLGLGLCHDCALEPGPDHRRPAKGVGGRRLPSMVQSGIPRRLPGALPSPAGEMLPTARGRRSTSTGFRRGHSPQEHRLEDPVLQARWRCQGA